ncbi:MAG: hypothetical protein KAJ06_09830 [Gammaproteobacteria bacterium]|nr:hypothetical protein [Gammaproteobacteria bacterium]MCK5481438.1 hypothetical protein [Gammaproteobacteria bacterium]
MGKTLSRFIIEAAIITGSISIFTGIALKLVHIASVYTPRLLGLAPVDFLSFGAVCLLFSIALTGRRILKHMEYRLAREFNNRER